VYWRTYASWREGYDCSAAGCMRVATEELLLPVLSTRLALGELALVWAEDGCVCFLQPEYSMIECKNQVVTTTAQ
jgi:hypothetical protein